MKHGGGHEAGEPADTAERRPLLGQAAGAAALNSSSSGSVCRSGAAAAAAGGEVFVIDVAPPQLQTVPPRPLPRLGSGPLPRVGSGCSSLCSRGGEPRTCRICFGAFASEGA
ncbi:hypothetical protein Rsub_08048 [Raphidocelis subcapitata]|uniref:Uncharacterized protein n=1 Tax=Raphidocelis subcapitata TaxID=307507 RepID=A0A2V0PFU1_9CHLO|nr:hypothetical protein Rsub_08048 [Raphidocelis subcapitata]|eukprot:GBF95925.1 hypothetical protein Rsub_08048 [Raphidocelis subcapitata]